MKYAIYGDGVRDDYYGIQAMLDQGAAEVTLPMPESNYRISKTLKIHSGQKLKLPRFARVVLADNANCSMIENDTSAPCKDVFLSGGVWDMNHSHQKPNPYRFPQEKTKNSAVISAGPSTTKHFFPDIRGIACAFAE